MFQIINLVADRLCLVLVIPWSVCVAIHQEAELRYLRTHTAPVTQMMHTLRPPTSLRLKELWLLRFKMQIPKREQHYLSLLWNQYRSRFSLSSLPSSRRYSLLLRCLVKRIQKRYKRKIKKYIHKWNFVLGSLNYLHVTSESFSFSKMPRQCWPGRVPRGLFRVNSALHLWDPVALKSLECPVHLFFSLPCVWISACLLQHSGCMKRSRLRCFISCLSLLQLN